MSLTIAEAAERTGLTAHTLRYYERDGLMLRRVPRSTSGHRSYTESDLNWIQLITKLRATGMPIRDVRRYTDLVRAGEGTEVERLAILQRHRDEVSVRLREVTEHMQAIEAKIAFYVGHIESCSPPSPLVEEVAQRPPSPPVEEVAQRPPSPPVEEVAQRPSRNQGARVSAPRPAARAARR